MPQDKPLQNSEPEENSPEELSPITGKPSKYNDPNSPDYMASDLDDVFGKDGQFKNPRKRVAGQGPVTAPDYVARSYHLRRKSKPGSQAAINAANNLYGMGHQADDEGYITDPITGIVTKKDNDSEKALVKSDAVTKQIQEEQHIEVIKDQRTEKQTKNVEKQAKTVDKQVKMAEDAKKDKTVERQEKIVERQEKLATQDKEGFSFRKHIVELEEQQRKLYSKDIANTKLESRWMNKVNDQALKQVNTVVGANAEKIDALPKEQRNRIEPILEEIANLLKKGRELGTSEQPAQRARLAYLEGAGQQLGTSTGNPEITKIIQQTVAAAQSGVKQPGIARTIGEHIAGGVRGIGREVLSAQPWAVQKIIGGIGNIAGSLGRGEKQMMGAATSQGASDIIADDERIAKQKRDREENADEREDRFQSRGRTRSRRDSDDDTISPRRVSSGLGFLGRPEAPKGTQDSDAPIKIDTLSIDTLTVGTLDIKNVDDHDKTKKKDGDGGIMGMIKGLVGRITGVIGDIIKGFGSLAGMLAAGAPLILGLAALASVSWAAYETWKAFSKRKDEDKQIAVSQGNATKLNTDVNDRIKVMDEARARGEPVDQKAYDELKTMQAAPVKQEDYDTIQNKQGWKSVLGINTPRKINPNAPTGKELEAALAKQAAGGSAPTIGGIDATPLEKLQNPTTSFHKMAEAPVVVPPSAAINQRTNMVDDATRENIAAKDARSAAPVIINNVTGGNNKSKPDNGMPISMGSARNQESGFARYLLTIFAPM